MVKFPILFIDGDIIETEFKFYNYDFTLVWDLDEFSNTGWYPNAPLDDELNFLIEMEKSGIANTILNLKLAPQDPY